MMNEILTDTQRKYLEDYELTNNFCETARRFNVRESTVRESIKASRKKLASHGYIPEIGLNQLSNVRNITGISQYVKTDEFSGWVKSNLNNSIKEEDLKQCISDFINGFDEKITPTLFSGNVIDNMMVQYCLGDAHFGLLSYEPETGEDYDTKIAEKDTKTAVKYLIDRTPRTQIGVLMNVGDLFHSDSDDNRTKSGNPLDTDTRQSFVRKIVVKTVRYAIDLMLQKHEYVWIVSQKGNHDEHSASWLNTIIEIAYENEPRVKVFPNDRRFTYFTFGNNFIGTLHGDKNKNEQRIVNHLLSDYRKELKDNNYVFLGHIHHKTFKEIAGVQFESMSTLVAKDYYHDSSCYGARRAMKAFLFHKEFGKLDTFECDIKLVKAIQEGFNENI